MTERPNRTEFEFRILGPLEVRKSGRALAAGGRRQRALLAVLLLHANETLPSERLIEELWGRAPPETAAKMIHNNVSRLRKLLEADTLVTRPLGYELRIEPDQLDATRFTRLVEQARRALSEGAPEAAAAMLREGLALWRGPALADLAYEQFAQAEIARLEELRLAAIEDRIEADLALGRHADVVGELEASLAEHPFRERLRALLMLALYRSGRQAEALGLYQETRRLLVEELGIEPSRALARLERAILAQDPELELEPPPPPEPPKAAAPAPAREVRKPVSVVFAEVTTQGAQLDPEALRRPLARSLEVISHVLARHGGSVETLSMGSVVAVFGIPVVHEDDPLRAIRAALELNEAIASLSEELEADWKIGVAVRAAVTTGEVVAVETPDGQEVVAGDAIDVAARLQQAAAPGEILIGETTMRLVEGLARIEAVAGPMVAWRLLDVVPDATIPRRLDAPMVGREEELAELRRAFDRAVRERSPYLFTVLGPAGIGKSRLTAEFAASVEDEATVLTGRCLPYGEGITFWPLDELVRQLVGEATPERLAERLAGERDAKLIADGIASAIGLVERATPSEETFWAARKLFEALARERPLVLVFEDLHWAEQTLLDLVEHVAEWSRDAPILLVCLARPDLLDTRPAWGGGKLSATSTLLGPLSEPESQALLRQLVDEGGVPPETLARIAEIAEGNPLFLEQMLVVWRDDEVPADELLVPPTVQALLAARLDGLAPEERKLLERASIIGREFSRVALVELMPDDARESIDAHLQLLVRHDLIRPQRPLFAGDEAFGFRHILLHEAAYESVPKEARARLHERFAVWLARTAGSRAGEFEEIVGRHLEQGYQYRAELGPVDEAARDLARQAAERLAGAGRRAYARGDLPAAVNLMSRASALPAPAASGRLELLVELGEALGESGDAERAERLLAEAAEGAATAGDTALQAHVRIAQVRLQMQRDPDISTREMLEDLERAAGLFERLGDERRLAKAWEVLAWVPWYRCQAAAAEVALQRAIEHARRSGDSRVEAQSLHFLLGAALFGPMAVADAIRRCEEILAEPAQQRRIAASALRALAGLRALEGRFDDARSALADCRTILEDLGLRVTAASTSETYGIVELLAGDPLAAERELRAGYESLEQMGQTFVAPVLAALLAQALYAQGRHDDALRFSEQSEQATTPDDLFAQVQWRAVRAKALGRLGGVETAVALAREAVSLSEETDFLVTQGDALMDLTETLRLADRPGEAIAAVERALGLYRQKGSTASTTRARAVLDEIKGTSGA